MLTLGLDRENETGCDVLLALNDSVDDLDAERTIVKKERLSDRLPDVEKDGVGVGGGVIVIVLEIRCTVNVSSELIVADALIVSLGDGRMDLDFECDEVDVFVNVGVGGGVIVSVTVELSKLVGDLLNDELGLPVGDGLCVTLADMSSVGDFDIVGRVRDAERLNDNC